MEKNKYLVLIPCLEAAQTVTKVMLELAKLDVQFDVVVIDNGSKDGTLNVVRDAIKKYNLKGYYLIRNIRNLGYGASQKIALFFGIYNGYEKLIIIHADNQYPVNLMPELIRSNLETKAAMTIGTRLGHKDVKKVMPLWRYYGNYILSAVNRWAYDLHLDEFNSEFRIYDLKFMHEKVNIDRCGNIENYTLDSLLEIRAAKGEINQFVIPCSYPSDAHHPVFFDLLVYGVYNFYKAFKFRLLRRRF